MMRTLLISPRCADSMRRENDPGSAQVARRCARARRRVFDIKANVAARTELGVSGYLRIESHGKQCRLTITPMGRTALALGSKEKPVE